ncbi:MAG TPA: hypothetical protein DEZ08_09015 [Dehalococcoidia bacterium]|jgi:hypothetical protein|nr:hypothetical protein [Dehalococcoidia bacterium]
MSYIGRELRQAQAARTTFTASGAETAVNVTYTPGQLSVFLNGIKLLDGIDYIATTGTSITGLIALTAGDVLDFIADDTFNVADVVPASTGGTFAGNISVAAATSAGHAVTKAQLDANVPDYSAIAETILPSADDTYDLGSAAKRWQNIYTTDLHLNNDRGDWTVIEEENYLTLRNNKTDKVYKIVMEEIE